MRRPGDRIFRNAEFGGKEAAHKIHIMSGCRYDDSTQIQRSQSGEIRFDCAYFSLAVENGNVIVSRQNLVRLSAQSGKQSVRRCARPGRKRGEIHQQQLTLLFYRQDSAARFKSDGWIWIVGHPEDHMCGCQRCMAAEIDLGNRREPAQPETRSGFNEKCGFGKIIFLGNRLQRIIIEPRIERANRGWVARKKPGGESIDLILPDSQRRT